METGICGQEANEVIDVEYSKEQLLSGDYDKYLILLAYDMAVENADMYGVDTVEDEVFEEDPYESVYGTWEIYDPEKHNDYLNFDEILRIQEEL